MKKGWEIKKLGEIAEITYGYTEKSSLEKIGPKFLRITDIQDNGVNWDTVPYCKIDKNSIIKYKLFEGDIVFARTGATTGKSYLINTPPEAVYASYLIKVHIKSIELSPNFLYSFFQSESYWACINKGISGSAQGGFNATKLSELDIPIPPLSEQQRIVSKLDKAFAQIETVKRNAERNLENAKELFQCSLTNELRHKKGWKVKMLKEIGVTQTGTTPKTADKMNFGSYIPFIKPADIDITGNGEIRYDNDGLSEQGLNNGRKMLSGSILMVCIGTIGKVGYADRDVSCNQQINSLTVTKELSPKFFYYALSTKAFYEQVIINAAQATLPIINKGKWETLKVSYPNSIEEQQRIVHFLDSLSAQCKQLEANYKQVLANCEELKKAILTKAFNGELSHENN